MKPLVKRDQLDNKPWMGGINYVKRKIADVKF